MALLGVVHRTVLGQGPPQFRNWFYLAAQATHSYDTRQQKQKRKHGRQLHDYLDASQTALLRRSPLAVTRVYNELPAEVVACDTVKSFQKALQQTVLSEGLSGNEAWQRHLKVPIAVK